MLPADATLPLLIYADDAAPPMLAASASAAAAGYDGHAAITTRCCLIIEAVIDCRCYERVYKMLVIVYFAVSPL